MWLRLEPSSVVTVCLPCGIDADELARFRAWFEAFDARLIDENIERDAKVGRLDRLAGQARADRRATRAM